MLSESGVFSDFILPKLLDKNQKRCYTVIVYSQLSGLLRFYENTEVMIE